MPNPLTKLPKSIPHIRFLRPKTAIRTYTMSSPPLTIPSPLTLSSTYPLPSDYPIPILGFGVYQTPHTLASSVVSHALATGYRHIDSAVAYRNEAASAQGLHLYNKSASTRLPRSEIFFTTKIPPKNMGYDTAKEHIRNSLKETGFEYIDLYLLHAPYGGKEARIGAWRALVEGVEAGVIRSIGVSNYGVHHLEELESHIKEVDEKEGRKGAGGVLSVNQIELHPWLGRKDIVAWCKARGIVVQAYCPIVRGERSEDPLLVPLAKKYGKSTAQILLRWSLQMGFVPLPKSVTPSRIEENANIFDFELTEEDMKALDTGVNEPIAWDPTVSHD